MRYSTVEKLLQMVLVLHSVITGIVWFQKISMPPNGRLFDLHTPHPPGFSIPGGLWWPPSPKEFPEFLNGHLAYHPLEIQSGFGT